VVARPAALDLPHALVDRVAMLIVNVRATGAASSVRLQRTMTAAVYRINLALWKGE
jgi:hypothetical protein